MSEKTTSGDGTSGKEGRRDVEMRALLRDLVREYGGMKAAEELGVSYCMAS